MDIQTRRANIRANLNALYIPKFDLLCEALDDSGQSFWAPVQGLRSLSDQTKLYTQGRTTSGAIVTNAQPGLSAHNYGLATDWAYCDPSFDSQQMFNNADWEVYRLAIQSIDGLTWGGLFKTADRPHNELTLKVSYGYIGRVYLDQGEDAAWSMIQANLL